MKLRNMFAVLLAVLTTSSFSTFKVSAQDMLLQDLTPSEGKVISIPASWTSVWYKGDSEQKVFDLLKSSMTEPMSDSDAQKFLGSEMSTAELFAFGQGDAAPLMLVLLRNSAKAAFGQETITIDDVLSKSSAKRITINGKDSAYNLMGSVTSQAGLAVLYIEDGGKSLVMAAVFASNNNWATQGDLLKQLVTSYRDAGQKIDTKAWKLIQMPGGDTTSVTDTPEPTAEPIDATATPKPVKVTPVKVTPTKKPPVKKPTATPTATVATLSGVIMVYTTYQGDHWVVVGMYPQGDDATILTPQDSDCYSPSFTADGTKFLAICTTPDAPEPEIYSCTLDSECTPVTSHSADDGLKFATPSFAPDGSKIAYARYTQMADEAVTESEIIVASDDGSNEQPLGFPGTLNWEPSWSPDSTKVVFISSNGSDRYDVFVVGAQGVPKQLTRDSLNKRSPKFSPDGKRIVYYAYKGAGGISQIYVMNSNGAKVTKLSQDGNNDIEPTWSPDGYMLAFTRVMNRGLKNEDRSVYVMQDDGNNAEKLATIGQNSQHPTWVSVGQ